VQDCRAMSKARSASERTAAAVGVILFLAAPLAAPAAAAPGAKATADVSHRFTFSLLAPDDICGPNASQITFAVRNEVLHWAEGSDGRFNVQFTQTGTYHVDFLDPALPDQDSQYTDSIHHVLTPSQTEVFNEAFHDFPSGIRIWQRTHVTVLADGHLIVERVIFRVTGCP
jgi:hypothetical protein